MSTATLEKTERPERLYVFGRGYITAQHVKEAVASPNPMTFVIDHGINVVSLDVELTEDRTNDAISFEGSLVDGRHFTGVYEDKSSSGYIDVRTQ